MSASSEGIGPLSVRYAAQIRELLLTQAVQRAAAEEEAARDAQSAQKAEAAKANQPPQSKPFKFEEAPSAGEDQPAAGPLTPSKTVDVTA